MGCTVHLDLPRKNSKILPRKLSEKLMHALTPPLNGNGKEARNSSMNGRDIYYHFGSWEFRIIEKWRRRRMKKASSKILKDYLLSLWSHSIYTYKKNYYNLTNLQFQWSSMDMRLSRNMDMFFQIILSVLQMPIYIYIFTHNLWKVLKKQIYRLILFFPQRTQTCLKI